MTLAFVALLNLTVTLFSSLHPQSATSSDHASCPTDPRLNIVDAVARVSDTV